MSIPIVFKLLPGNCPTKHPVEIFMVFFSCKKKQRTENLCHENFPLAEFLWHFYG